MQEAKALFPDGLCCEANPDLSAEQVPLSLTLLQCCVAISE